MPSMIVGRSARRFAYPPVINNSGPAAPPRATGKPLNLALTARAAGHSSPLYKEHTTNKNEHYENKENVMLRLIVETAAEITSLVMFGSAIALWSLALAPMA